MWPHVKGSDVVRHGVWESVEESLRHKDKKEVITRAGGYEQSRQRGAGAKQKAHTDPESWRTAEALLWVGAQGLVW